MPNYVNVTGGGPQGTIFIVLLFSVYTIDLTELFVKGSFFANNTKMIGSETHQPIYKPILKVLSLGAKKKLFDF